MTCAVKGIPSTDRLKLDFTAGKISFKTDLKRPRYREGIEITLFPTDSAAAGSPICSARQCHSRTWPQAGFGLARRFDMPLDPVSMFCWMAWQTCATWTAFDG